VEAYLAQRALDYVMGTACPWCCGGKLPGSKSAGRVQSVALRLVTDREHAIRTFQQREYWFVDAACQGPHGDAFQAALTHLDG
jgi:DNA topoisomerase-1